MQYYTVFLILKYYFTNHPAVITSLSKTSEAESIEAGRQIIVVLFDRLMGLDSFKIAMSLLKK